MQVPWVATVYSLENVYVKKALKEATVVLVKLAFNYNLTVIITTNHINFVRSTKLHSRWQ